MSTGVGVEGILRQSADVEDVERRVREYEQGNFGYFLVFSLYKSVSMLASRISHNIFSKFKLLVLLIRAGRNEFSPDEDAHVIGDCIKVELLHDLNLILFPGLYA